MVKVLKSSLCLRFSKVKVGLVITLKAAVFKLPLKVAVSFKGFEEKFLCKFGEGIHKIYWSINL